MDAEQARALVRKLPHVAETMQWGENLVYWVGDKAAGGRMFALIHLDEPRLGAKPGPVLSFYAGPARFAELLERDGVVPAPYLARWHWVALERWDGFGAGELKECLAAAHAGVAARLPARTRAALGLPDKEPRRGAGLGNGGAPGERARRSRGKRGGKAASA